ncbi:MAG: tetratricopeptide repeat protein [Chloroflexota bacterium]
MTLISRGSGFQRRPALTIIFGALCVVPILLIFLFIQAKAQNAPWLDQWHPSVLFALKTVDGTLRFSDLFYQHNEHRIFFTNLVTVLLTIFTHWDIRLESYLSWLLAIANAGLLAALFRRLFPRSTLFVIVLFFLLTFSFRQSTGWLFGFMNCWYFLNFFFLLGIYILSQSKIGWKPLILAVGFGWCALFSLGAGLLVQGLLLVLMWSVGYRQKRYYAFWLLATAFILVVFFYHYHFNALTPAEPIMIVQYVLVMLGGQFIASPSAEGMALSVSLATWIGLVGLVLLAVNTLFALKRHQNRKIIFIWLVIAALPVASAFIAAPNRVYNGVVEALQSKSVILSHLFWVAVIISSYSVWVLSASGSARWRRLYRVTLLSVLLILAPFFIWANYADSQTIPFVTETEFQCYLRYPSTRERTCLDDAYQLTGDPSAVLEKIDHLAVHRLTGFAYVDDSLIPEALVNDYYHIRYELKRPLYSPYVYIAETYAGEGDLDRGIFYYSTALSIIPSDIAYLGRAGLYFAQQEYAKALADYTSAIQLSPGFEGSYAARGEIYAVLEEYDLSIQDYSNALGIMPDNTWLLTKRGIVYARMGNSEAARSDFQYALTIDPLYAAAQEELAKLDSATDGG